MLKKMPLTISLGNFFYATAISNELCLILFFKYLVYIRNLKYAHLTPIFRLQISIQYSIPTHTNINGYCDQKNSFKRKF